MEFAVSFFAIAHITFRYFRLFNAVSYGLIIYGDMLNPADSYIFTPSALDDPSTSQKP